MLHHVKSEQVKLKTFKLKEKKGSTKQLNRRSKTNKRMNTDLQKLKEKNL